jgi:hypothetical protein
MKKIVMLIVSHATAAVLGFGLGIYLLPILIAPDPPTTAQVREQAGDTRFAGRFRRDLQDSDALHWGEGAVTIGRNAITLEGRLAPGPDYRLYLSPEFIETESEFNALKPSMTQVGRISTFENFVVPLPPAIDPAQYSAVIVWCESFGQFITAAEYLPVEGPR